MVLRRMAFIGAVAALAMVPAQDLSAQYYYQRHYGEIPSPGKHLGEIRPNPKWLGKLRGPQGYLTPPVSTVIPPIGGGFVMQAEKPQDGAQAAPEDGNGRLNMARDIPDHILSCWRPPSNTLGDLEVTVRMSFSKIGDLIGEPRVTYVKAGRDEVLRDTLRASILSAVRACTPLRFTPAFGKAIAGRSFAIRFIAPAAKKPASAI
ncbi:MULTISPECIES: hypothetical protein [unclassified Beijerinckia]|uniref:hypothetical protein n=1 Tax=unclassified Beijerinckia TaxID=2638183 RepID=UPI000897FE2B|nr:MULTISPECIES: hypothetical protein [unclassified Beijerinckia]MDH7795915.1 hypothetical protein [Beijerinckia sp. GAS462]SEC22051.1 hypothetical protein SAMN05443249_2194 [Beijerinckia sp. 28-YEA-48]